jgi:hypothetical protein
MNSLKEVWSRYADYTRDVTEHGRKLAFGGVAVCWLFRDPSGHFPFLVLVALALILFYFVADLAHQFAAGIVIKHFAQREEARLWKESGGVTIDGDVEVPLWLDKPAYYLYFTKVAFLFLGFVALICHIAGVAFQH